IRGALAKDVGARFPTAEAMIEALTAARQALSDRDDGQATILLRTAPPRAPRWGWWAAVSVAVIVAGGFAAARMGQSKSSAGNGSTPGTTRDSASPPATARAVSESAFAPLRRAALDARARASQAGAGAAALAVGD